jgi:hypothetical protein
VGERREKEINNLCVLSDPCGEILLGTASDFMQFHTSGAAGKKKTASLIKKETFGVRFRNRPLLGFAIRNNTGKM